MKAKAILNLLILCIMCFLAEAQSFTPSEFQKETKSTPCFSSSVPVNNGYIVIKTTFRAGGNDIILSLVNEKMETIKETQILLKNKKIKDINKLLKINGSVKLIYGYKNSKKDSEFHLSAITINPSDLSLSDELEMGQLPCSEGSSMPSYQIGSSFDSLRCFAFLEAEQNAKELKRFSFIVFNKDMKMEYKKNEELAVAKKFVTMKTPVLDNTGNLLVQYKVFEKDVDGIFSFFDNDDNKNNLIYDTKLIQYSVNGMSNEVSLGVKKYINDLDIVFNKNTAKTTIVGSFRNDPKESINGIFYGLYNPNKNAVEQISISEVPASTMTLFNKEETGANSSNGSGISRNFRVKKISNRNNGTIDYTLEYDKRVAYANTKMVGALTYDVGTYYINYSCFSILNINIGTDGKMIFTRIPKKQTDLIFSYLSNYSFYYDNKLIFLYNDDVDNVSRDLNLPSEKINEPGKKSVLVAATLDDKGHVQRKVVYSHDDKYITEIGNIDQMCTDQLFVVKRNADNLFENPHYKLGKLTLVK